MSNANLIIGNTDEGILVFCKTCNRTVLNVEGLTIGELYDAVKAHGCPEEKDEL